jgi:hypothetical protein
MTTMIIRRSLTAVVLGAALMGLTSCGGKKKQEEIDRLTEEAVRIEDELLAEQKRADQAEADSETLREQIDDLEREKRDLEGELKDAQRDIERFAKREALAKERDERERAREPSRAEKLAVAKTEAGKHLGALVTVKGDVTSGSGFLVSADEKTWVYMAAGVMAGNTKLEVKLGDGSNLTPSGTFEMAGEIGVARLEVTEEVEHKMTVAEPSEIRSGVALLGVGEGGALVEGRCYDTENGMMRLDARLAATLPGSPVFHGETGALIGIVLEDATEERKLWKMEDEFERAPKRGACRLDRSFEWASIPINTFLEEAKTIGDADRLTRLVEAFVATRPSETGVDMSGSLGNGMAIEEFLKQNSMVSAVVSLKELDQWLEEKGERASATDVRRRTESVYTEMGRTSGRHTATFAEKKFSPYHAKMAEVSLEWRRAAEKKLADLIKGLEK